MADTERTLAALTALFADNITGDISPQDLRDFLLSTFSSYASIYVNDGAVTQAGVDTTPTKMTGFAADGPSSGCTPAHASDQITIDVDGDYFISLGCSFSGATNKEFQLHVRIDGVEANMAGIHRKLSAGGDVGSSHTSGILSLSAGEVLTVWVESNDAGGVNFLPGDASLSVKRIG